MNAPKMFHAVQGSASRTVAISGIRATIPERHPLSEDGSCMDQDKPDFDDLFEPFELGDAPPDSEQPRRVPPPAPEPVADDATGPVPAASQAIPSTACPSCGSPNPEYNRHCEQCGARLSQDPLPVAPAPNLRSSPGGRALGVLGAVVLLIALATLIFNVLRGDDVAASTTTSSTTSTTPIAAPVELFPLDVEASSSLEGHEPENLIDGNDETDWNDASSKGLDAWIKFTFASPVRITEIRMQNLLDDERFKRNYKIQGYVITTDDLSMEISGRMQNTNEPQRIPIASLGTTELTIEVKSTYPGEAAGDKVPYSELALQAVRFFGTDA